jgi:hypothetical protein
MKSVPPHCGHCHVFGASASSIHDTERSIAPHRLTKPVISSTGMPASASLEGLPQGGAASGDEEGSGGRRRESWFRSGAILGASGTQRPAFASSAARIGCHREKLAFVATLLTGPIVCPNWMYGPAAGLVPIAR